MPTNNVDNNKWCYDITGNNIYATFFSYSVPLFNFNSKFNISIDNNPYVFPEQNAANNDNPNAYNKYIQNWPSDGVYLWWCGSCVSVSFANAI